MHESRYGAARYRSAFSLQLKPYFARPIHHEIDVPHSLYMGPELFVALFPLASPLRIDAPSSVLIVGRGSDLHRTAERLDSQSFSMVLDEGDRHLFLEEQNLLYLKDQKLSQ